MARAGFSIYLQDRNAIGIMKRKNKKIVIQLFVAAGITEMMVCMFNTFVFTVPF